MDDEVLDESVAALLRQRRIFLLTGFLLSCGFVALGILMIANGPKLLGYLSTGVFVLIAILWGLLALLPAEDVLEMPDTFFHFCASDDTATRHHPSKSRLLGKSRPLMTAPASQNSGVWDRELDGGFGA